MREPESKLRQRRVGRLDRSRDPAILNAALAALTENGYDARLTVMRRHNARPRRRILPHRRHRRRLPALIKDVRLIEIEGGPHNIGWTHPDEVNKVLLDFVAQ